MTIVFGLSDVYRPRNSLHYTGFGTDRSCRETLIRLCGLRVCDFNSRDVGGK